MLLVPPLCHSIDAGSSLDRPADPVVLTAADVPSLVGIAPADLVAFRYAGAWQQIPVQVDERDVVDWATVYDRPPIGVAQLVFTDPGAFTGPDSDPLIDADDEIVFMAANAGGAAPLFGEPTGVVTGTGVELIIEDPLVGGVGRVYLFQQDGTLDAGAGGSSVDYRFELLSGDYLSTYNLAEGPNPEDSTAGSAFYRHHFSDRWIDDELRIFAGDATGADILDRHKDQFSPGSCNRTEDTFSAGEGAFVVNKSGPVRAIRSYLGANSGPLTQREHVFYEQRHDIRTFLRVHVIPGVVDYFDYGPDASGMSYFNNLNPDGVTVDGSPDSVVDGVLSWEMVDGEQGGLVIVHTIVTDILNPSLTSYYLDDSMPSTTQCTGDSFAYGSSGPWFDALIPCTDPAGCPLTVRKLAAIRTLYYGAPGITVAEAIELEARLRVPLEVASSAWAGSPGAVPPGTLLLAKSPGAAGQLDLSWDAACSTMADLYAVYEGALGSFASHLPVDCSIPGTSYTLEPLSGNRYYLVVPNSELFGIEGSYGTTSDGNERPPSTLACRTHVPHPCPPGGLAPTGLFARTLSRNRCLSLGDPERGGQAPISR